MDERRRGQSAAAEAHELGWGGISLVSQATGLSRPTIAAALAGTRSANRGTCGRGDTQPASWCGSASVTKTDPGLLAALESLLEPSTRGDPMSPLRWTRKSTRHLAEELTRMKHAVGPRTRGGVAARGGIHLQAHRKTREGASHPDRNAQLEYINATFRRLLRRGQPAVSVDKKKKELRSAISRIFRGREWHAEGEAGRSPRPRLPRQDPGQSHPLRCL